MSGIAGIETHAHLKGDPNAQTSPVIMLSTADNPRDIAECYRLGSSLERAKSVVYAGFAAAIQQLVLCRQRAPMPTHSGAR